MKKSTIISIVVLVTLITVFSTANAAVIQCNNVDCSLITAPVKGFWSSLIIERKASIIMLLLGIGITIYIIRDDKEKAKKESAKWLNKYTV